MKVKLITLFGAIALFLILFSLPFTSNAAKPRSVAQLSCLRSDKGFFFEENKGQLYDENGDLVKYYGRSKGVNLYCKPGMVSFVFTRVEKEPRLISEATGLPVCNVGVPPRNWLNLEPLHCKPEPLNRKQSEMPSKITIARVDMVFVNANPSETIIASEKQAFYENFYTTGDADNGITNVHTYKTVTYKNIYPDIDLILKAVGQGMEYSFLVHPGGKISDIQLAWNGVENTNALVKGGICFSNAIGDINESAPKSFVNGQEVLSHYLKQGKNYGFMVGNYNKHMDLLIDPTLTWATYYGGEYDDEANGISIDAAGNVFITGETYSGLHIATSGAYQTSFSGTGHGLNKNRTSDVFIAKFNAMDTLEWATYYGGPGDEPQTNDATGIKTDAFGNAYIVGTTVSATGIATSGAFQTTLGTQGQNAFLAKFNNSGTLAWATYFGGNSDISGNSLTTDTLGSAIIVAGPYLAKFSSSGTETWQVSQGQGNIQGNGMTTDASGNIYIASSETSSGMATSGAYQTSVAGNFDAFLSKFNSSGTRIWATYFGGNNEEEAYAVIVDKGGNIFISGMTKSTTGLATTSAHQTSLGGDYDAFLAKFNSSGTLSWCTYYGGSNNDVSNGLGLDVFGDLFMVGTTSSSSGIATSNGFQTSIVGQSDAYVAAFSASGNLKWASYYGEGNESGSAISTDAFGDVYFTGTTTTDSGLATENVHQTIDEGQSDVFLVKFVYDLFQNDAGIDSVQRPAGTICAGILPVNVYLHNAGTAYLNSVDINWSINGVGQPSVRFADSILPGATASAYLGLYNFKQGQNKVKIWSSKPNGQIDSFPYNDTLIDSFVVNPVPLPINKTDSACYAKVVTIGSPSVSGHHYKWTSPTGFTSNISNPNVVGVVDGLYILHETIAATGCSTIDSVNVKVNPLPNAFWSVSNSLKDYFFKVKDSSLSKVSYTWNFGDSSATETGYYVSHIFPENKKYTVKLLVTNQYGCTSEDDSTIDITNSGINPTVNSGLYDFDVYPNPFKDKTLINFTLPQPSHVIISLMDMKGNVLCIPLDKSVNSGPNEVEINTSQAGLSPGTYFVKFEVNDQSICKKIIELK